MLNKSLFLVFLFILVLTLLSTDDASAVTVHQYNFSNQSNILAYETKIYFDTDSETPPNHIHPTGWANETDITNEVTLDYNDDNYQSTTLSENKDGYQLVIVSIQEQYSSIKNITWKTKIDNDCEDTMDTTEIYFWNFIDSQWDLNESFILGTNPITKTYSIYNINKYVSNTNSNNTAILYWQDGMSCSGFGLDMKSDYYFLTVTTDDSPNITTPTININTSKSYAFGTDKLNGTAITIDDLNTTPNIEFTWYNDTSYLWGENVSCTSGSTCVSSWLTEGNFTHFNNITLTARAYDGKSWSGFKNATKLYINNSIPTTVTAIINDTAPDDTKDLKCNITTSTDADTEDTITYYYNWYKNSTSMDFNDVNLGAGNTTTGEVWQCEAWVGDGYNNCSKTLSSGIGIGSGIVAPVIDSVNATYNDINATSSDPINNNTLINFGVGFTDPNTESWTEYVCTNNNLLTCNQLCASSANSTGKYLNCSYDISGRTASSLEYYTFVKDSEGYSSSGKYNIFYINHHPDSAYNLKPTNLSYTNQNSTQFNWSNNDVDGDVINSTLYLSNSTDNLWWLAYNGTGTTKIIDDLLDGYKYFWRLYTIDEHNASNNQNTSTYERIVDYSPPNVTNQSLSSTSITAGSDITIYCNVTDKNSTISSVSVIVNDSSGAETSYPMALLEGTNIAGANQLWSKTITPGLTDNWNIINYTSVDLLGNTQAYSSQLSFTVNALVVETPGGGGGGPPLVVVKETVVEKNITTLPANATSLSLNPSTWKQMPFIPLAVFKNETVIFNKEFASNYELKSAEIVDSKNTNQEFRLIILKNTTLIVEATFDLGNKFFREKSTKVVVTDIYGRTFYLDITLHVFNIGVSLIPLPRTRMKQPNLFISLFIRVKSNILQGIRLSGIVIIMMLVLVVIYLNKKRKNIVKTLKNAGVFIILLTLLTSTYALDNNNICKEVTNFVYRFNTTTIPDSEVTYFRYDLLSKGFNLTRNEVVDYVINGENKCNIIYNFTHNNETATNITIKKELVFFNLDINKSIPRPFSKSKFYLDDYFKFSKSVNIGALPQPKIKIFKYLFKLRYSNTYTTPNIEVIGVRKYAVYSLGLLIVIILLIKGIFWVNKYIAKTKEEVTENA